MNFIFKPKIKRGTLIMKLRQKLAVALAATMVVTAVPVTTMAAVPSVNTVSAVKDNTLGFKTSGDAIILGQANQVDLFFELSDREQDLVDAGRSNIFFVEAKDAEFSKDAIAAATAAGEFKGATVKWLSKSEIQVTIEVGAEYVTVPLYVTVKSGEPRVIVDGTNSVVDSKTLSLTPSEVGDKLFKATADSKVVKVTGGEVGAITLEETVAGSFNTARTFTVELPTSTDVVFTGTSQVVTLKGARGLASVDTTVTATITKEGKKLEFTVPAQSAVALGSIKVEGITVESDTRRRDLSLQDIEVTVKADKMSDAKVKVGEVKEEAVSLKVKEEVKVTAGKGSKEVVLTLEGATPESLEAQLLYFTVENAKVESVSVSKNDDITVGTPTITKDEDEFELSVSAPSATKNAKIELKVKLLAEADATGDITVSVEGRRLDPVEVKVGEVVPAVTVTSTSIEVQPGLSKQAGGSITLTETSAGDLERGFVTLSISSRYGVYFTDKDLDIKTTGTLAAKVKEIDKDHQTITLEVTRTSREAAELTISGFAFDVDGTVPTGDMKLEIGGTSIAKANTDVKPFEESLEIKNFIKVVSTSAAQKVEAAFTMSANTYVVNGQVKVMDVAPYVSAEGRTMVPVRFLADALGLPEQALAFNVVDGKGVVTIIADSKVITLVNGEKTLTVNGATLPLTSAVTIKDGRTFTPVTEIATVLGMSANWDAATQTATFSK
jgi:hypothetical protein